MFVHLDHLKQKIINPVNAANEHPNGINTFSRFFPRPRDLVFVPYNNPFFVVMFMNTDSFCESLNAFEISEPQTAQGQDVVSHSDLFHYRVYHGHKQSDTGKVYILCRESPDLL